MIIQHPLRTRPATQRIAAVAITLAVAVACWVVALRQMHGMDMGTATVLGSFASFVAAWVSMMAAMMLPGAVPAVARRAGTGRAHTVAVFVASYLAVWAVVGLVVYVAYRPHGTVAAGVIVLAAGCYELTPLKTHFRERCRAVTGSGLDYGVCCVGSSFGLMAMFVALGVMNVAWMVVVAAVVAVQKLVPPRAVLDVTLALLIIGLGVLVLAAPSSVPGLMPSM